MYLGSISPMFNVKTKDEVSSKDCFGVDTKWNRQLSISMIVKTQMFSSQTENRNRLRA